MPALFCPVLYNEISNHWHVGSLICVFVDVMVIPARLHFDKKKCECVSPAGVRRVYICEALIPCTQKKCCIFVIKLGTKIILT